MEPLVKFRCTSSTCFKRSSFLRGKQETVVFMLVNSEAVVIECVITNVAAPFLNQALLGCALPLHCCFCARFMLCRLKTLAYVPYHGQIAMSFHGKHSMPSIMGICMAFSKGLPLYFLLLPSNFKFPNFSANMSNS